MSFVHMPKMALAGIAATLMASSGALAWTVNHQVDKGDKAVQRLEGAVDKSLGLVPAAGGANDGGQGSDGAQGSGGASVSGPGAGGQTGAQVSTGKGGTRTQAGAGAVASGPTGGGGGTGGGAAVAAGATTGTGSAGTGTGSGGGTAIGGAAGSGAGSGSNRGGSGGNGGTLTPPAVPTVPTDVSPYQEGSYDLFVPGTAGVNKKLCLSGEVNRCQNVTAPPVQGTKVTVSYSANAGAGAPTFAVFPCQGGLGVKVSGISPGTKVKVQAAGVTVSGTLTSSETSQSASLCDA